MVSLDLILRILMTLDVDTEVKELLPAGIQQELSYGYRLLIDKMLCHPLSALPLLVFELADGAKVVICH